jgi:uncharacterized protein YhjY with autotransporter beta-barrel domain
MSKKVILLVFIGLFWGATEVFAQCAMCRTTVEKAMIEGQSRNFGAGLNAGILYLFVMPYILIGLVAYLWYKHSKKYTEEKRKLYTLLKKRLS